MSPAGLVSLIERILSPVVLIIGPSGVGKSELCREASKANPFLEHVNVDLEIKKIDPLAASEAPQEKYWKYTLEVVAKYETQDPKKINLIDIGAGSLQTDLPLPYLQTNGGRSITILDTPTNCRNRAIKRDPFWTQFSEEDYARTEFSAQRTSLYSLSGHQFLVNGQPLEELVSRFASFVISRFRI